MGGIGEVQLGISTARSGALIPVCRRRPVWPLGVYGQTNVAWGNYARFVNYTAKLNWFLPAAIIPELAIVATAAETLFGILLVLGWKTRITALLSGVLLATFALAMTMAFGNKSASRFLGLFGCRGSAAPGSEYGFPHSLYEFRRHRKAEVMSA